jgi:hypothetical protein
MDLDQELIELERSAWEALATSGEAAAAFYEETLSGEVLMLLPGGMVIDDRAEVIASMGGPPWDGFELDDPWVLRVGRSAAVVAYRGRARRGDMDYEALFNSTYVDEGGQWRLAVHQQTPV